MVWVHRCRSKFGVWTTMSRHYIAEISLNVTLNNIHPSSFFFKQKDFFLLQITSNDALKSNCEKQLCIISILPHILDCQSKCRNDYIKIMTEMGDKYKKQQWG